jgi:cytochrome c553
MMSMDHKELVDMANNKLEKSLYQQYIKEMAAHSNKQHVPGGNQPQQQPQVAPQNPDNGPIIQQH